MNLPTLKNEAFLELVENWFRKESNLHTYSKNQMISTARRLTVCAGILEDLGHPEMVSNLPDMSAILEEHPITDKQRQEIIDRIEQEVLPHEYL